MKSNKKAIIVSIISSMLCIIPMSEIPISVSAEEDTTQITSSILGDINSDNEISVLDIIDLQKYILNIPSSSTITLSNADINKDNEVDIYDLGLLKRQVLNQNVTIESLLAEAVKNGYSIKSIPTADEVNCTLISRSDTDHIIYIPDGVTKLNTGHIWAKDETTGYSSFKTICEFTDQIRKLEGTIKVIGGNNLNDANRMFNDCRVQSLDLSSFSTSKITDMSYMFSFCNKMQSLDLSNFDTSNVTNMSHMFSDEKGKLKSIDVSSFDTSKVTDMSYMFLGCKMQSLDLSNFDTSNVTDMSHMFELCQTQSIDLSSFDTSNVTNVTWMFTYAKISSISMRNLDFSSVTKGAIQMFDGCEAEIIDLSGVNFSNANEMSRTFRVCKAKSIDITNMDTHNVRHMSGMFVGCESTQIKGLETLDTSNVINMYDMFRGCKTQSLDLSNFDTSNVTDMSYMFDYCEAKSIDLSSFDTSNVTNMSYMFRECKAQIKVTDPKIIEAYNTYNRIDK